MAKEFKDYYAILGVTMNASADEITKAFRRLSRKYHPDINKEAEAAKKYKEITEAYEVLSDKNKRRDYDLNYNHLKKNSSFSASENNASNSSNSQRNYTEDELRKLRIIKIKKQILNALSRANNLLEKKEQFENNIDLITISKEDYDETVKTFKEANEKISDYLKKLYIISQNYNLEDEKNTISEMIDKLQQNSIFLPFKKFASSLISNLYDEVLKKGNSIYQEKANIKYAFEKGYISEDDYEKKRTLLKSEEQDILKKIDFLLTKNLNFKLNYEINNLKFGLNDNDILNYNYEECYRKYNRDYIGKQMFIEAFNLNSICVQYNQTYDIIKNIDSHILVKEIETNYLAELISKMNEFYKKVDDDIRICFSCGYDFDRCPPAVRSGTIDMNHSDMEWALNLLKDCSITYNYSFADNVDLTKFAKEEYRNLLILLEILKKRDEMTQSIIDISNKTLKIDDFYIDIFKGKLNDKYYIGALKEVIKEASKVRKEIDLLQKMTQKYGVYVNESDNKSFDIIKMLYANLEYKLDVYPNDFLEAMALGDVLNAYREEDNFRRISEKYVKTYGTSFTSVEVLKMLNLNGTIFSDFKENTLNLVKRSYNLAIFKRDKRCEYLMDYLDVYPDMVKKFDYDKFERMVSTARGEKFKKDVSDLWDGNNQTDKEKLPDLKEMFKKLY